MASSSAISCHAAPSVEGRRARPPWGRLLLFALIVLAVQALLPIQPNFSVGYVVGSVITGVLYAVLMWQWNRHLPLGRGARFLVTWPAIYVVQMLNPLIEGIFFTTQFQGAPGLAAGALVFGAIVTAVLAAGAVLAFPGGDRRPLQVAIREDGGGRSITSWAGRVALAAVAWAAIYLAMGWVISPWVLPYYTTERVGFELALPALPILALMQVFRGWLYALALLPFLLVVRARRSTVGLLLAGLFYVGGAVAIFLISDRYPPFLRLVHGIELAVDALLAGLVFAYALGAQRPAGKDRTGDPAPTTVRGPRRG